MSRTNGRQGRRGTVDHGDQGAAFERRPQFASGNPQPVPGDPAYGEWCAEHGDEMQDHDCAAMTEAAARASRPRAAQTILDAEARAVEVRRAAERSHAERAAQVAPEPTEAAKPAGDPDVHDPSVEVRRPPEPPPTTIPG